MSLNIVTFSGGKDSLATVIWAKNNLENFEVVFCDTGWESELTYEHIKYVEKELGLEIKYLRHQKYKDLIDLFYQKKRAASTKARFCTEELKVKPMIDYILSKKEDVVVYQGVRADESTSRSMLKMSDEYFKFYFEPYGFNKKGKPKLHTYRKKEVIEMTNNFSVDVYRPFLKNTANEVFDYIFENGLKPNPLYFMGFSRVGCFPCIMCRQSEIKNLVEKFPERIDEIRAFEKKSGRSFFPPNMIPVQYCSVKLVNKKGQLVGVPYIDDIVKYLTSDKDQVKLFDEPKGCISVYNICETGN